jgi:hypothetical protein
MKIFRLAALGAALVYLSDATRRARLRDRVLGLIGGTRESGDVAAPSGSGDVDVSDDLEQRVRTAQGADSVENLSETSGTETPTTAS